MATKLLVCLALLGTAAAGPSSRRWSNEKTSSGTSDCALQCSNKPSKFNYNTGNTYIYQYEVNTETAIAGASEDTAVLNIQTHAEIEVLNSCEFSMNLKNTQVSLSDPYLRQVKTDRESEFQRVLQRNLLRFSFDDGHIKTICPEHDEDLWVLNFKRGLLSAFQNSMENFDKNQKVSEVDVTGHCKDVEYNVSKTWSWRQKTIDVSKSKNLLSCSHRDGFKSILQMVPYTSPSEIQSLPIIKSTHDCEQKIIGTERILHSSSCKETHIYAPFSNQQSGGRVVVTQKLTYQNKKNSIDTLQGKVHSHQSLLFQHMNGNEEVLRGQESAEQKLKEICEQTNLDIRPETPRLFAELVEIVRTLEISDLRGVYQKLRKKTICPQNDKAEKFFFDTLPVAGTPGAVEMMLIVFKQNKVNEVEKEAWLMSLSLINNPPDEMMPLTMKLLKEPLTLRALLPVSALVNNYCQKNANCVDNYYISQLIDLLDEKINLYCSVKDNNKQMVLRTLRAIGNIGNSRKFVDTIDRCIRSTYAPIEVKISAINAYRRIPCPSSSENDDALVTIFQDKNEDSELRIASYQALMRCPTDKTLAMMVKQLNSEESDEVGEYIYSHLNNLMKTSDPHKQDIARTVRSFTLTKKFEANLRSSRNYESSILLNKFNLGYAADADLIWSKSSSFVPRSFKANVTMDLFGNSINLFDFGGRMDGIEHLVENLLGPNKHTKKEDKPWSAEDLRLCLYGRIFGNEVAFKHIEGDKDLHTFKQDWNMPELLIKWSKKIDYDYTHNMQLFSGSLIIPTVAGLPINVTVNSSASIHLGVKAEIDLNKILTKQRSFSGEINSVASGGLEVTGSISVDAHFKKVGLRMRNTLHSSLPIKGRTSFSRSRGFSFEIDTPDEKIELFDARSQFFIIYDNYEKEQKMIKENRKEFKKCTGTALAKITGFEMCGEVQFSNASMVAAAPYFPLAGSSSVNIVLHKRDTHSGYKMFAKWDKKKVHTFAQFQINTPGSQVNRLISTDITLGYQKDKHIDIIVTTPWKKLNMNGKLVWNKNIKRVVGNVRIDQEEYGVISELTTEVTKKETKYTPLVEIIYKGVTKTIVSGKIIKAQRKSLFILMDLNTFDKPLCTIKGSLSNTVKDKGISLELKPEGRSPYRLSANAIIKTDKKAFFLRPTIIMKSPYTTFVSISGSGDLRFDKRLKAKGNFRIYPFKLFKLSTDFRKISNSKKGKTDLSMDVTIKSSAVNGKLNSSIEISKKMIKGQLKGIYDIQNIGKDVIIWHGKYVDESKMQFKQLKINSNLSFKKNSDYNIESDLDIHQKKETKVGMAIRYGKNRRDKNKQINIDIQLPNSVPDMKNSKVYGLIRANIPEKKWNMEMELNHAHIRSKLNSSMNFQFLPFVEKSKITVESNLNPKEFILIGSYFMKDEKLYSVDLLSKMKNWKAGRWSVEAKSPKRNVELKANLRNDGIKITGDASLNWDAGKNKRDSSVVSLTGSFRNSKVANGVLMKTFLELKSPFKNVGRVNLRMNLDQQPKRLKSNGKLSWGGKQNQMSVDLMTSLPLSPSQIKLLFEVKTPFRGFRQIEMNVDHELNSELITILKGKMNNAESKLSIKGNKNINERTRNVKGEISLNMPFKNYREIQVTFDHNDDYKNYKTTAGVEHDSKIYMAKLDLMHDFNGRDIVNKGKLILTSPDDSVETVWNHNTENNMKKLASKLKSSSNKKELFNVKVAGSYKDQYKAEFEINMDTKWKAYRKLDLQMKHKIDNHALISSVIFTKNKAKTGYDLNLLDDERNHEVSFVISLNPLYKRDISLRANTIYYTYPIMTAFVQLEWAPLTQIIFDGSLNAPSIDNFDQSLKLSTPFEDFENIHIKSSIKKKTSDLIANLNIDYAVEKMIDIETRFRNDELVKLVSAKLTSPFPFVRSFYSGIQMDTDNKMELKADLDLKSYDKYGSHISLMKQNADITGVVQIETPIEGYTNIEAKGLINTKRRFKKNIHLSFKTTKSTNNVYSLDSSYKMKMPFQMDVKIRTPHPEFDDVGLVISHDFSQDTIVSSGSITYLPKKTVEVSLNLLYSSKIDGNLVIKTPFEFFEQNKLSIIYDGKINDFNSHGSAMVGDKQASYDLNFKNAGSRTSGGLTFTSSLKGLEMIKGSFMIRGKMHNLKGEASMQLQDVETRTEFSNRVKKDSLKSGFMLMHDSKVMQISVEHEDKNALNGKNFRNTLSWKIGQHETKIETNIDHIDFENTKASIIVNSTCSNTSINLVRKADNVDFSLILNTQGIYLRSAGIFFKSDGPIDNLNSLFKITYEDHSLFEVTAKINKLTDASMNGKFTLGGASFKEVVSEMSIDGDRSSFTATGKINDAVHKLSYIHDDQKIEWNSLISYRIESEDYSSRIYFMRDLSEDLSLNIKCLQTVLKNNDVYGFDIEHKGHFEKFTTSNKFHLGEHVILDKLVFFRDGWERVEIDVEQIDSRYTDKSHSMKFRFEGQDTRVNSNIIVSHGSNKEHAVNLLIETSPRNIFTFSVKNPNRNKVHLLLSTELTDGKLTSKAIVDNEMQFSVSGVFSNSVYPYHPHIHLMTPYRLLKDLQINVRGQLMDGSADLTLLLSDSDSVEGKGSFKYVNPFSLTSSVSMDSTFENFDGLLLELRNTEDYISKKSVLNLALGPEKKISVSGDYLSKSSVSNIDEQLIVDVKLPIEKVQAMSLTLGLQKDTEKADGQIGFDFNYDKVLDMNLNYNVADKKSVSITMRKPKVMEYSLSQKDNGDSTENEVYLNWNRDEPESNIRVKSTFKDVSDSSKTDRAVSLTLVHPIRSIGMEHSQVQTSRSVVSAGKLFWNVEDDSNIFYKLNLGDKSQRRVTVKNGDLTVGWPMRTIGLSGKITNNARQLLTDASFSWDMDNDKSKRINLNAKVSGDEQMNADISLKFPAEVQINSKLILNQGNTIFDGQTDISYSWDDRKTLTLFSKVVNNPEQPGYFSNQNRFNYSIQFGIRHPDTKVEMIFDSHLGHSDERLTGSLGLDYLTSYRQKKNMALWLEIDKLKKEINLISTNPYKNIGVSGSILSEDPLRLQAVTTIDDEEKFKATLDMDQRLKKLRLGLGKSGNTVRLTAFYPNESAVEIDVQHNHRDGSHEEAGLTMYLSTPTLLLLNFNWRPEMMKELRKTLFEMIDQEGDDMRSFISEIYLDVEKEIVRKYEDIITVMSEDAKPVLDFVKQELNIISRQITMFRRKWKRSEKKNVLYIGDLMKLYNGIIDSVNSKLALIQQKSIQYMIRHINSLPEKLEELGNYPIRQSYKQIVAKSIRKIDGIFFVLKYAILNVDQEILDLKERAKTLFDVSANNLLTHPRVKALIERLESLTKINVSPVMKEMITTLEENIILIGNHDVIMFVKPYVDLMKDYLSQNDAVELIRKSSNEAYQQAKWAYNYWEVEDNLPELVQSSVETIQEIVEEEIREMLENLIPEIQDPIRLYDPENGVLKTAFSLPIEIKRLDKMPNFEEHIEESSDSIKQHMPDVVKYLPKWIR